MRRSWRADRHLAWRIVAFTILVLLAVGCASGLRGQALVRQPGGGIGAPIAGVELTFIREDGTLVRTATTAPDGRYSVSLPAARYYVRATHRQFEDDFSAPGFSVVSANTQGTMNVFLREPRVTTIFIVRHAEKQDPNSNDPAEPLSTAGAARAERLRDVLFRAGVTAIFSTNTVRTRSTVEPLRLELALTTQLYGTPAEVASAIIADHLGDVVLVAAHSDTVADVANALGGAVPGADIADFDNLYAVARSGNAARVVNLQYGDDAVPDLTKNSGTFLTFLLVRQVDAANPPEASRLLHALRKSGVGAIHVNGGNGLVQPLATALGLTPQAFTSAGVNTLVDGLVTTPPAAPVLIVGTRDDLRAAILRIDAHPTPILYDTDRNNLIVVTRPASGVARAVSLLY